MSNTTEEKIKFLRELYPNIEKMDFMSSQSLFFEVKRKLVEAKFYKVRGINEVNDSAVFNLIKKAQLKEPFRNIAVGRKKSKR